MTQETSTRIGLPVVLAFAIVFGLILTRHSGQYEVAPPSPAERRADEGVVVRPPIDRAGLGERTFAHRQAPRSSSGWSDEIGRDLPPARPTDLPPDPEPASSSRVRSESERPSVEPSPASPAVIDEPEPVEADSQERRIDIEPPAVEPDEQRGDSAERRRESPLPQPEPKKVEPKRKRERIILPGQEPSLEERMAKAAEQVEREAALRSKPGPARPSVYVVQRNDNLSKICKAVYGTMDYRVVQAVYEANRDQLKSKNRVLPGQKLRIPHSPLKKPTQVVPTNPLPVPSDQQADERSTIRIPPPAPEQRSSKRTVKVPPKHSSKPRGKRSSTRSRRYKWYRVGKNESLSRIAQKRLGNGRRWREIWEMNKDRIRKPNKVYAGKLIKVPLAVPVSGSLLMGEGEFEASEMPS